jgi:hypothetical protein
MVMSTYTHRLSLGIALVVLPLVGANAQLEGLGRMPGLTTEPRVRIGFGGGMSVPRTGVRDALKSGVNGEGFLLVRLPGGLPRIRLALDYQKFDMKETARLVASSLVPTSAQAIEGQTEMLGGVGGFRLDLFRGPVRPYILAGVGAFNVKSVMTLATTGASSSSSATNLAIDGGAGIALKLGRIDAFIEARIQNVYADKAFIDTKKIQAIPVTFGILF